MKWLCLLLVLSSLQANSQNRDLTYARQFSIEGNYDSAVYHYERSEKTPAIVLEILEMYWKQESFQKCLDGLRDLLAETNDEDLIIRTTLLKGKVLFSMGKPAASAQLMDSLLAFVDQGVFLSETYNTKSKSLLWVGDVGSAVQANKNADSIYQAANVSNPILLGNIFNVKGILNYFEGDFDQAIVNFKAAIETKSLALKTTHPDVISLYGNVGVMYKNKQEYDKALQYYGYELENYATSIGNDHLLVATSYQNIGSIYLRKSEYGLALEAMNKALDIRRKRLGDTNPLTLDIYEWIGNIQAAEKNYAEALNTFIKVLEGRKSELGTSSHFVSLAHYNIAEAYFNLGNYKEALSNFRTAAEIGKKVYDKNNHDQASNYNGMAMCLEKLQQPDEARRLFKKGLIESVPGYQWDGDTNVIPPITSYLRFQEVFASLVGLANSFGNTGSTDDLNTSLSFIEAAKNLLETHKRNFTIKSDKITIANSSKELADLAIEVNYALDQSLTLKEHRSAIFEWSEYVKGSTLLSTISDNTAKRISGIPDSLLTKELKYRTDKDSINTILTSDSNSNESSMLRTALLNIEDGHQAFIADLERSYPTYTEKKYGLKPLKIEEVSASIADPKKAIVQYFLNADQTLFVSVIKANNDELVVMKCDSLSQQVSDFRSAIASIDERIQELSYKLYHSVFQPLAPYLETIEQLTIITDGVLGYIPFELLQDPTGKYLFEKYLIKYELSSTLEARKEQKEKAGNKILVYAPEFDQESSSETLIGLLRSDEIIDLPGAREEAKSVSAVMNAESRIGKDATESSFKNIAQQFDIIHLATHSIINERDPSFTKLIFSKDSLEDGQLHVYELENTILNADLVTLSACNTGIGRIAEGEGVMSLARSFRSLGVPSVVMSLWPASDKSTPELMKYFYENLKEGQAKDVALNNARKTYLKNAQGKAKHPFYWGGFVIVGNNSSIENDSNSLAIVIPSMLAIVMIFVFFRRRKKVT